MPSCNDCGVMFENMHDLQRHVKMWCPENQLNGRWMLMSIPAKKRWLSIQSSPSLESDDDDQDSDDESEEDIYFERIVKKARDNNEDERNKKREKYIKDGLSEEEAVHKADTKMKNDDVIEFMDGYAKTIRDILLLRHGKLHLKIMESVDEYIVDGIDQINAIRMTLRKYKHELEEFIEKDSDETDEIETSEEADSDDDSYIDENIKDE